MILLNQCSLGGFAAGTNIFGATLREIAAGPEESWTANGLAGPMIGAATKTVTAE